MRISLVFLLRVIQISVPSQKLVSLVPRAKKDRHFEGSKLDLVYAVIYYY